MQKRGASGDPRAALWATLTIVAFPLVAMSMGWFGVDPFTSFVFGAAASLLVLTVEAVVRGRWWISDPAIARIFSDPSFGYRLLVLVGIVVLLFQSLVLVGFMTDPSFDGNIVRFVLERQCEAPSNAFFSRLCREAAKPPTSTDIDLVTSAVREAAETRFFAGGLITCAAKPLVTKIGEQSCTYAALIRCDRWVVGRIAGQPISVETIQRPVIAILGIQADGTYRVNGWSDDPTSPEWISIGGTIASHALEKSRDDLRDESVDSALAQETFRRVMERISQ